MWSPKQQVLRLARSLRRARSIELPKEDDRAVRVLHELIVSNQHSTMADLLSTSSFDVNHTFGRVQRTLLHLAANCGHFECLTILLKRGSNPNIQDISGTVPLHLAARNGKKRCAEKLLECGADPDLAGNDGATTVHWLAVNGRDEILKTILSYTSQVNLEDGQGHTALHAAARNGHTKTMDCLIEAGADINHSNAAGITPLHSACFNGQRHAVALLLSKGALLIANCEGQTPVALCLKGGYGIATELLLKHSSKCINEFINKAVYNSDMNDEKVTGCVKHFAKRPLGHDIAEKLATETTDIGFRLLSLSTECDSLLPSLLRSSSLLVVLCSSAENVEATGFLEVFNIMEQLWKSIEDWLILLRDDVDCEAKELPQSQPCNSQSQGVDETSMLNKMSERLSALIHVFYKCVSCHERCVMPQRFTDFIKRHMEVLKIIVYWHPEIIFQHFSFLFNNPDLMSQFLEVIKCQPFVDRYKWFYNYIEKEDFIPSELSTLQVHRNSVFEDSCSQLENLTSQTLKQNLSVQFIDEAGVGDGVLREWFSLLSEEILNPQCCLFTQSSDGCTFQPCSNSSINPDHLSYFKFAGRILGLALYHRQLVNVSFTLSFYKHLLGIKVNYTDVASIDPEYAKNLQWILDNDVTDLGLELNFVVETDVFGSMEEIELKPDGANIPVTQENKAEYVQLVTELRMTRAIQPQINAFMEGFNNFIPSSLIQIFTESELDLLLSGSRDVNIDDWKQITNYSGGYDPDHEVIIWFWQCVEKMSNTDRSLLIQFTTGRSRLPSAALAHADLKFMITEMPSTEEMLPTASTCMNMLKLPNYSSYKILEEKLGIAIHFGSYGYTFT